MEFFSFVNKLKIKIWFSERFKQVELFLKCFYFYLAFVGIFGFSLFIAEESIQCIQWGSFAAQDARRYDLVRDNCEMIKHINSKLKWVNNTFMWINPFQYWSYGAFGDATDTYVASLESLVLANDPEVYLNEYVTITFKYNSFKKAKNGLWIASNGKVKVVLSQEPTTKSLKLSGVLRPDPDRAGGVILVAESK